MIDQIKERNLVALAVDIHRLLKGGVVEWERIDFRRTFHPLAVLRSICAFANDINSTGGGYIIIGVDQDEHDLPVFPVRGLSPGEITIIRQELFRTCKYINPPYYPIIDVVDIRNKQILVLWVPTGANRPYQIPRALSKLDNYSFYVRSKAASTRKATDQEKFELVSLANQISFDDQIHYVADITDLKITLIQEYLVAIKSGLSQQTEKMSLADVCASMNIAADSVNCIKPKNVGILLFSNHPEKFLSSVYIKVVEFDGMGRAREKFFTGPLFYQLDTVLTYIKATIITKMVEPSPKASIQWEYFNYPFGAVKEALINSVYHRDYKESAPIEVRILPIGIEIINFPGPMPPLDNQKLKLREVALRRYRNPSLGHFLKQMRLVQGNATGLDRICFLMENNGNPPPTFQTDKKRTFFKVFLPIHSRFAPNQTVLPTTKKPVKKIHEIVLSLAQVCPKNIDIKNTALILLSAQEEMSLEDLMFKLNQTNKSRFRRAFINPLISLGWLQYTVVDKLRSRNQKYLITQKGRAIIEEKVTEKPLSSNEALI